MLTLWDLIKPRRARAAPKKAGAERKDRAGGEKREARERRADREAGKVDRGGGVSARGPVVSMQDRYEAMTREMLSRYGVRVRKWRKSMTGVAWQLTYADGSSSRLIEAPRPRGPMSAAVFLHEIGHHAIGFNVYRPRCLEEYHAWRWSLEQMRAQGLNVTASVERRMHASLWYAIEKAKRRGLREVPAELEAYTARPARRR